MHIAERIELKDDADPVVAVTTALADLTKTVDDRIKAVETKAAANDNAKLGERLDRLEAASNRPGTAANDNKSDDVEVKAFTLFVRRGREALGPDEVKTLRVADDTAGGYLAPAEFSAEVDKNIVQFSPVRQAARVGSTAAGSVIIPKRTGRPTGSWVGETETRTGTESTYGQAEIEIFEMACYVDVSNKLLEDSAINIASEVSFDLGEEFGRMEGAAFVSGNGAKKPIGFMSDANVGYTAGGHASVVQADGLISLMYAMAPYYRGRGTWMMNGTTLGVIRKLKDGQGQYLWQPGLTAGQPETILGRPVVEAVDMPDVAADAFPIAFGDFSVGYRIYDRVALSIIRDPYTQATVGTTRFHARRRVGAGVVRAEAIRKLKIATS